MDGGADCGWMVGQTVGGWWGRLWVDGGADCGWMVGQTVGGWWGRLWVDGGADCGWMVGCGVDCGAKCHKFGFN